MAREEPVEYPLALRLLDHQIEAPDSTPLANVDDIELELNDTELHATALLCGPAALGERLPGRLASWTLAVWRRITLDPYPAPIRIPLTEVQEITSAVRLTPQAAGAVQRRLTLEAWLRQHLINKIPGSGAEPSPPAEPRQRSAPAVEALEAGTITVRLSALLGYTAYSGTAGLGRVHEVTALHTRPSAPIVGRMPVNGYVIGPRNAGSTLGYDRHPEHGPRLLRAGILALHRHDVTIAAADVTELDPVHRRITVGRPPAER